MVRTFLHWVGDWLDRLLKIEYSYVDENARRRVLSRTYLVSTCSPEKMAVHCLCRASRPEFRAITLTQVQSERRHRRLSAQ